MGRVTLRRVLCKTRLILPRINGPIVAVFAVIGVIIIIIIIIIIIVIIIITIVIIIIIIIVVVVVVVIVNWSEKFLTRIFFWLNEFFLIKTKCFLTQRNCK